ncbi:MAG: hypothetical protein AB1817_12655 [Chloroflexota bacterium]
MSSTNDPMAGALGGLLGALLGGTPQAQNQMQQTGQSLDDILGSNSGSQAAPAMNDLLGALLGSASTGGTPAQGAGGDALGALLGSMLGGGAPTEGAPAQGAGGDMLGSLLGSMLGGGAQPGTPAQGAGGDQISSMLGGLLGVDPSGGAAVIANNPIANGFVAPIVEALARKTGIAPGIAQVVVVFAINALLSGVMQQGARQGFNSSELVEKLSSGEPVTQKYLKDSGLLADLTQQTGLSQKTASQSLQQVFQALGTQMGEGTVSDHQEELQTLLKKWK